jgi:hypothetical protein
MDSPLDVMWKSDRLPGACDSFKISGLLTREQRADHFLCTRFLEFYGRLHSQMNRIS